MDMPVGELDAYHAHDKGGTFLLTKSNIYYRK